MDRLAIAAVLLVAALFTGTNMFRFPQYELDEGTYMGSAWAMFEQGKLYFYTYTYDHTLLGWFQVGAFAELVGGFLRFGTSVNTGRVLMLVVTILSALLVYLIVRRASGRVSAGLLGAVVFAVSPLGVTLHRQVWLDNFAALWLLVSLYALLVSHGRLWRLAVSALALSLAFWSKEVVVVFLPGMLYLAYALAHPAHRRFAFGIWGALIASVASLFVVLALLKDELLPPGVLWSSEEPHVSMVETYRRYAASEGGSPFSPGSDFRTFFGQWTSIDAFLIVGGLAAVALGLLFWRRDKLYFGMPLLAVPFLLFLALGGLVRFFYVIPLLPILAISLGLLAGHAIDAAGRLTGALTARSPRLRGLSGRSLGYPAALAVLGLTVVLGLGAVPANSVNFNAERTPAQTEAARFVANNLPNESAILMDPYPWADLRDEALVGDEPFRNAHAASTALQDPAIYGDVLRTPGDVDYLLYGAREGQESSWIDGDPEETGGGKLPLVEDARKNSDRIKTFRSSDWRMELLRVRNLHQTSAEDNPMLRNTWESYEDRFIRDGRVIDPKSGGKTTSEGQAYAMLRAVYTNDEAAFDEIWGWARKNLQEPGDNSLLAWNYGKTGDGTQGVTDFSTATDADTDAALALLFASQKFDDPAYEREALEILDDVWNEETVSTVAGYDRVLVAGDWARGDGTVSRPVTNPSYLSPYAYKIFADADPSHDWDALVDSSYGILQAAQTTPDLGGKAGVVPNWISIDPETGSPDAAELEGLPTDEFSFDATRVPWRISLDHLWFGDERALEVMESLSLPRQQIEDGGKLFASYGLDGEPTADYEATSAYAGVLPGLLVGGDPAVAHRVFAEKILGAYNPDDAQGRGAYWGEDPNDYYNQNMAWFATAVMDGSMSNLYADEEVVEWEKTTIDPSLAD
ncbi:MAG: glycosyl hydrolase family 8 [Actinomycetota bacterium]|nr:glycosyl hydrolase family 8 [Actinomycetota bacterium]